ncbi:MAG: calcium/sodium antiporter [Alphaproteobacteria bacterium]|nr:calcium/sodium antiporter [Alphaproteobacteria bacterium]
MVEYFWIFRPLLFILGFVLLIGGGNLLVNGAVALARRLKLSPLLIGLTIVGFGTSVPELIASLFALNQSVPDLAVGNVIGSNIANILLVLGAAACIRTIKISKLSLRRDGKFLLLATFVLLCAVFFGRINFWVGLIMCLCLAYYVYYAYQTDKKHVQSEQLQEPAHPRRRERKKMAWVDFVNLALGIGLTCFGANILVDNAVLLAQHAGISTEIIGLTLIAIGTSLPELATSVVASVKKQSDIAFGNIVGSNIYNALFILGFLALFKPIHVQSSLRPDVLWMTAVTLLLLFFAYTRHKLSKATGALFLVIYAIYIYYLGA